MLRDFLQDIRYGIRSLSRSPGFFFVGMMMLALGIGANTAIFSVVNGVILKKLPYKDPSQLVVIWNDYGEEGQSYPATSPGDYVDYRERSQLFEEFAATSGFGATLTGKGEPEQLDRRTVTPTLFPLLGAEPFLGRIFTEEESVPNGPALSILSYRLWETRFGKDPEIIDKAIQVNGQANTVVGVMPPGFKLILPAEIFGTADPDIWTPAQFDPQQFPRNLTFLNPIGRLKPGVTIEQAQEEMDNIAAQLRAEHSIHESSGMKIRVVPMLDDTIKSVRGMLWMLLGAVAFVLLIACGNVANLLLARAAKRRKEISIRTALGAGRGRIVRQILAESFLLSAPGAVLATLIASTALEWILAIQPGNLPRVENIAIDGNVLLFTTLAGVATTFLFGLGPAFYASRTDLHTGLKEGGRTSAVGQQARLRNLLVTGQIALSLVLLVGAGLMFQSLLALQRVKPGFRTSGLLTFRIPLNNQRYPGTPSRLRFYEQLKDSLGGLPGVEAVAAASQLPLTGQFNPHPYAYDAETEQRWESLTSERRVITPGFFETTGTRILAGRDFDSRDSAGSEPVSIVDTLLARRAWPDEDPIGKRLLVSYFFDNFQLGRQWTRVVGLVEHVRDQTLSADVREHVYLPFGQQNMGQLNGVVRASAAAMAGLPELVRGEVRALDSELPVTHMQPITFYVADSLSGDRFGMILVGIFAVLAVFLASIGLYGVVAYLVSQRLHEFGVRMALGARNRDIFRLVFAQGLKLSASGVVLGLLASLAFSRVLRSSLFEISPLDPLTYAAVAVLLTGVTLLACSVPALRATRVDPMLALRYE